MRAIVLVLVLFLYAGCASTDLHQIAMDCNNANLTPVMDEQGVLEVVGGEVVMLPDREACKDEWAAWNKQQEWKIAREERKRTVTCTGGNVRLCDKRFGKNNCSCVSASRMRRVLQCSRGYC